MTQTVIVGIELKGRLLTTHSLKDKRRLVKSLLTKTRQTYQVAINETGGLDDWRSIVIGCAVVSNSYRQAEKVLNEVINTLDSSIEIEWFELNWIDHFYDQAIDK